jgi:hypothetical protein
MVSDSQIGFSWQSTPQDGSATVRVNASCDAFMEKLWRRLYPG